MSRRKEIVYRKLRGYTVFIVECPDGTYASGFTSNLRKKIARINHYKDDYYFWVRKNRVPVKVVYKETKLPFKEAYTKWWCLKLINRVHKEKLIKTGVWTLWGPYKKYIETGKVIITTRASRRRNSGDTP